jgi:ubiquinone/menaquinone biosynthesis C-methylase UbiE
VTRKHIDSLATQGLPSEDLAREYDRRFKGLSAYRDQVWRILSEKFFQQYIPSDSVVLDLGSGWGEFIRNIRAGRKVAFDLNATSIDHGGEGVEHIVQSCAERWPLPSESLDVVFTSNLLEHLPGKPQIRAALGEAHRCLRREGLLICMGPNIRFVGGAYWDFWDHEVPLTDQSMQEILEILQFSVIRQESRFLPYTMSAGFRPPAFFVALYLRMPFLWRFLGKQFLLIARK